jgi:hypothetical protein
MHLKLIAAFKKSHWVVEDQWSWTTNDGRSYENVAVQEIVDDEVIFQHQFGTARLSIIELSMESMERLRGTAHWAVQGQNAEAAVERVAVSC